jgi:hypothetical protein
MATPYLLDNGHWSRYPQSLIDTFKLRLRQDALTGDLYWTEHPSVAKRFRGKKAGCVCNDAGNTSRKAKNSIAPEHWVIAVGVSGKRYKGHQIAFALTHGYCPEQIDHFDGNSLNNRIGNLVDQTAVLSDVERTAASRNLAKKRVPDRPGLSRGIYLTKTGRYRVRLRDPRLGRGPDGLRFKERYIGTFDTLEEAERARDEAYVTYRDPMINFIPPLRTNVEFPSLHI